MELDLNSIIAIAALGVAVLSLLAMVFGFRLGKHSRGRRSVLYRTSAEAEYQALQKQLATAPVLYERKFEGGKNKIIPQLQSEWINHNREYKDSRWNKISKTIVYIYRDENGEPWEKCWGIA